MNIFNNLTKEEIVKAAHDGIDAPYIHVGRSALGGTPIVTVCLKAKADWAHGIMQNETYAYWNISENGTVENWSKFSRTMQKQRKFQAKSWDEAIMKINQYVLKAKHFLVSK